MLDNAIPAATASDGRAAQPAIADFFVYPRIGLCVVSGIHDIEIVGIATPMVEMRSVEDLKNKIRLPLMKFPTSGVRRLATTDDFILALEEAGGRARGGGMWQRRAEAYRAKMGETHPVALAGVLRDILGPKRGKQYEKETFEDGKPKKVDISYSEAELVDQALNLLALEMRHVTGMTLRESRSLFLRAALNPNFKAESIVLKDMAVQKMSDKDFKGVFGMSIADAKKRKVDDMAIVDFPAAVVRNFHAPVSDPDAPRTARPVSGTSKNVVSIRSAYSANRAVEVKEELKDLYQAHLPHIAQRGVKWKAFTFAAMRLNPGQFNLLCRVYFRKEDKRETYEAVAQEIQATPEAIRSAAESALEDLKRMAKASGMRALANLTLGKTAKLKGSAQQSMSDLAPDVAATYRAENAKVPVAGMMRALYVKAARVLNAQEFSILIRHDMRNKWQRLSMDDIATADGLTPADVLTIRNAASAKLAVLYASGPDKMRRMSALNPYGNQEKRPGRAGSADKKAPDVAPENRDLYTAELNMMSPKGLSRAMFFKAAAVLTPDELSILSRSDLRRKEHRMTLQAIADADGIDVDTVREKRNAASAKLATYYQDAHERVRINPALNPQVESLQRLERAARVRAPRLPRPAKRTPEEKQLQSIPEANRTVFAEEQLQAAQKGSMRGLFLKAAQVLSPEQLSVLSKLELRSPDKRISIAALAAATQRETADIIAIRNAAAERMKAEYAGATGRIIHYAALNPLVETPSHVRAERQTPEEKQLQSIPEANRTVFAVEHPLAAQKGSMRGLFLKAAHVLSPDQLSILSQLELRTVQSRVSVGTIATAEQRDVRDVIAVRDAAAARLREEYKDATGRLPQYAALNPYPVPRVKAERVAVAAAPKPARTPVNEAVRAALAAYITGDHLVVSLALPLSVLKDIPPFTVTLDIAGEGPDTVSAEGRLRRSRGKQGRPFSATTKVAPDRNPA